MCYNGLGEKIMEKLRKLWGWLMNQRHSLRLRMVMLVTFTVAVLVAFLMVNNVYAISVVRNNAYEANATTLKLFMSHMDDAFDAMDKYLIGLQDSTDMPVLVYPNKPVDFYLAKTRLVSDMASTIQSYNYIDNLFIYASEPTQCVSGDIVESQYFDAAKYTMSGGERKAVKTMIKAYIDSLDDGKLSGDWECMAWNDSYYLVRVLRYRNIYMGGCVNMDSLLESIKNTGFAAPSYLTFYRNFGDELGNVLPTLSKPLGISDEASTFKHQIEKNNYLVISQPSRCGAYSLVALVREQSIIEGLGVLQKIIIILGICLILFMGLFTTAIRLWILRPVKKLYQAMNRLKDGDLSVRLGNETSSCREFELVNQTFDTMIENIKTLTIDVYEEKVSHQKTQLRYQKAELQYMKLQVNPHFYINCLNIIHNLSIMNKNDLVRDMTTYLGNHLRYTMEGTTVDALYKEVAYVENYLHIQELRFPGSLSAYMEIAPDVRHFKVPPLVIQTFVENTVKYQVVAGERTEIYIVACCGDGSLEDYISIEIWDSGEGFSEEILNKLNGGEKIIDERGEHFGIRNVMNRLFLIYKGKEKIVFDNHWETGGAHILIQLPKELPDVVDEEITSHKGARV